MRVIVTESFAVGVGSEGGWEDLSPDDARGLAREIQAAATKAEIDMEDHIAATRRRGWVPPLPSDVDMPAPGNIADTCCGVCPGASCYVDQVTGA